MSKKVIDLEIVEELEMSGVYEISLVDSPAIEKVWMAFKEEKFVEPGANESQDEFIGRCIEYVIGEGKDVDQAAAICYSKWDSFDMEPNPCWEGYEPYGLKEGGVPNCIPVEQKKQMFAETYTDYPEAAKNAAKRALEWADKNGWGSCGTPVGKQRANQLAKGEAISEDTIARMSAFARHKQNSDTPYGEGCGKLMWDAWGGDAGIEWAARKLEQIRKEKQEFSYDISALPPYVDQGTPKRKKENQYELLGIPLPRGEKVVLQAEDTDYNRGLIVELKEDGGYDIQYWFETPDNIEPAEIKIDGKSITEEKYYVKFSPEVIKKIAEKFMREMRNHDTNIQHDTQKDGGSYVMETWIVENPEDKANSLYKMDVPVGSWMVKMRVHDKNTWAKIKSGELRGFSIEGDFMAREDYEAYRRDKELYNRIIKILKSVP
jgi:hypothetical protein